MYKTIEVYAIALLIAVSQFAKAQNVLPDPGFEIGSGSNVPGDGPSYGNDCDYYSVDEFDNDLAHWQAARHNNDKGNRNPDWINDVGCYNTPIATQCGYSGYQPYGYHAYIAADVSKCKKNIWNNINIKQWHEAIRIALLNGNSLTNGKTYVIRYKLKSIQSEKPGGNDFQNYQECLDLVHVCHMRVFITKLGQHWNNNAQNDKFEAISANVIRNLTPSSSCGSWEYIERTFTVPSSGTYKNLVLYMETGAFEIDDVELFDECTNQQLIQNRLYPNAFSLITEGGIPFKEKVSGEIIAGNNVGALGVPVGNVTVQFGANVVYTAGSQIRLKPGFTAMKNSSFKAIIAGCPNNYKLAAVEENNTKDNPPVFYSEKYKEWLSDEELKLYNYLESEPIESQAKDKIRNDEIVVIQTDYNNFQIIDDSDHNLVSVTIYDVTGKVIGERKLSNENNLIFDINAAPGLYVAHFITSNNTTISKKIIIN
jgi:hypothetical protein